MSIKKLKRRIKFNSTKPENVTLIVRKIVNSTPIITNKLIGIFLKPISKLTCERNHIIYLKVGKQYEKNFSCFFTNKLINGETIKIFNYGNCKRDFTYVDDIFWLSRIELNSSF